MSNQDVEKKSNTADIPIDNMQNDAQIKPGFPKQEVKAGPKSMVNIGESITYKLKSYSCVTFYASCIMCPIHVSLLKKKPNP